MCACGRRRLLLPASATRDVAAALPPDARGWLLRQAKVDTEDGATIMFAPSTPDGAAQSGPFQRRSSKFCKYCNVHQPINSVHCQDCGVCVRGYERAAPCTSEVCACVCGVHVCFGQGRGCGRNWVSELTQCAHAFAPHAAGWITTARGRASALDRGTCRSFTAFCAGCSPSS